MTHTPVEPRLLEEIGLSEGEVKVYYALLRLGITKTGPLASQAGVSSSKVYKILGRLEKKGLAGHVMKGEIKHFRAMQPERLLDFIDEKEQSLREKRAQVERILPQIKHAAEAGSGGTEATIYSGRRAIENFFRSILDELSAGETYYVIGAGYGSDVAGLRDFFLRHHIRRARKGVRVKMLANFDVKGQLVSSTGLKSEIRYLPQYLITNMEIVFFKDKVFIAMLTAEPTGFLLESREAVNSFQAYFDAFWKIARP